MSFAFATPVLPSRAFNEGWPSSIEPQQFVDGGVDPADEHARYRDDRSTHCPRRCALETLEVRDRGGLVVSTEKSSVTLTLIPPRRLRDAGQPSGVPES